MRLFWPRILSPRPLPIASYFILAQVVIVVTSIIKIKAVTIILGIQGIALYGIITSLCQIGSHLSLFGMHSSGVRSIAGVRNDQLASHKVIGIYFTATVTATCVAAVGVPIGAWATGLLEIPGLTPVSLAFGLSLAIALSAFAAMQGTVFKGVGALRMVVARNIVMPLVGCMAGAFSIVLLNLHGIIAFFIFQSLAGIILSALWWERATGMKPLVKFALPAGSFRQVLRPMIVGGGVFLLASLIFETSILAGRTVLQQAGEVDQLAYLNASWVLVTMAYGFMHGIMSTWLYPILANAVRREAGNISGAVEAVVLLTGACGSLFVILVVPFSGQILQAVYSAEFLSATTHFNLAMVGLLAQLLAAPILYLLLSRGNDRTYLIYHLVVGAVFVLPIFAATAATAHHVLKLFAIANWLGVGALLWGLQITGAFTLRPRTLMLLAFFLASALLTVYLGEEPFVRSVLFLPVGGLLLAVALVTTRKDLQTVRKLR